jgi:DNA polymerase-3 subunit gamma/tau
MLSKGAFNALLKILEEPPAHVIFMLATTDVHKVPDTVLSRCEVYTLNRPTRTVLADVVKRIAKQEKYKIDPGATDLLALIGDGSFRDTLSLLQQTMTSVSDAHITDEAVQRITGAPAHTTVRTIIDAWVAGDAATALRTLVEAHERGSQMQVLYARLLDTVRAVLLVRFAPDMKETLQKLFSPEDMAYIAGLSDPAGPGKRINSKMLKTILDVGWGINRSEVPHIILEALSLELSGVGESPNQSS